MIDISSSRESLVLPYEGLLPRVHECAWLAPGSVVVGDVDIGCDSSVWYGSIVRADVNAIHIGERTNLQDHCVVHVTKDRFSTWIGDEVTVGHRATVHGCRVEAGALIGIAAVVLDGAVVGEGALVAAGALVAPGSRIPAGALAVGVPARIVRELSEDEREDQRERTLTYVSTARKHRQVLKELKVEASHEQT